MPQPRTRIVFGITGASGTAYARVLLQELLRLDVEIHLVVSAAGMLVIKEELDIPFPDGRFDIQRYLNQPVPKDRVIQYEDNDLAAPPASGSFRTAGMVICPCSMRTLATIASGTGGSLITRAADACLKERRRLVLVPRETPLSLVHLRNMVSVTEAGAIVLPAMPGFYKKPQSIDDLLRHVALKVLDVLGLEHSLDLRWKDPD
ncbi:MAG: UbiX family flavin prenyltransferase [Candidatus Sumerlaeaceae bacterium]